MNKITVVNGIRFHLEDEETGDELTGLGLQFPHLEILNISFCSNLSEIGLGNLLQMSGRKLKDLKLLYNESVTGNSLGELALQFPELEILNIFNCLQLTNKGLGNLMQMSGKKLKDLKLYYNERVTGEGLGKWEQKFPQLERLQLENCGKLTDTGLVNLLKMSGSKLKHLELYYNVKITGDSLGGLQFLHLETLNISNCWNLTDTGLVNLLQMTGKKLKDFELSSDRYNTYFDKVTGDSLGGPGLKFPQLETLNISECRKLTDTGLVNLLQMSGNKLKHLQLYYNVRITGDGLAGLGIKFPVLEKLDLNHSWQLTDMGLVNLLQMSGEKLVDLDLCYCSLLSDRGLRGLLMIPAGQLKTLLCRGIPNLSPILKGEIVEYFPGCRIEF